MEGAPPEAVMCSRRACWVGYRERSERGGFLCVNGLASEPVVASVLHPAPVSLPWEDGKKERKYNTSQII